MAEVAAPIYMKCVDYAKNTVGLHQPNYHRHWRVLFFGSAVDMLGHTMEKTNIVL